MSEQSAKTKRDHLNVWNLYCEKIKDYGPIASKITRTTFYEEISDMTDYSASRIKAIINKMSKNKSVRNVCV